MPSTATECSRRSEPEHRTPSMANVRQHDSVTLARSVAAVAHQLCTMQTLPLPEHVLHFRPVVLTVDDADNMRDALRVVLEGECDVIEAQNGAAALDLVRERRVDLVLLDVLMPKKLSSRSRTSSTLFTP